MASFARGGTGWMALGTGLFLISALLDQADGELMARSEGASSPAF